MTELHPASLAGLVRSVAVLALPYERQVTWLASLGLGDPEFVDELALELGDGVLLSRQFEEAGWISSQTRSVVVELDRLLTEHSGPAHEEFWRLESLRDSPDWVQVRDLAMRALTAIR